MRSILLAFSLFILLSVSGNRKEEHEFYVSISELAIKDDTLQISMRLFTDDLEKALNERSETKIFLNDPSRTDKNFIHIRDYIDSRFSVSNAAKADHIHWLGHEFEDDVCWVYGEVPVDPELRILFIKHTVLMDIYSRQQNILHFDRAGEIETKLATKNYPEVRFSLE
jgi:hypothetical protein